MNRSAGREVSGDGDGGGGREGEKGALAVT